MAAVTYRIRMLWPMVLLLTAGCATYTAPDSSSDLVTVSGEQMGEADVIGQHREYIWFTSVDGKKTVSMLGRALFVRYPKQVRIAPGSHRLGFEFVSNNARAPGEFWLDAFPGREYMLRATNTAGSITCWVESRPAPP